MVIPENLIGWEDLVRVGEAEAALTGRQLTRAEVVARMTGLDMAKYDLTEAPDFLGLSIVRKPEPVEPEAVW